MLTQQAIIDSLPSHLQPFAALQDYSRYTPRDQAVWRFLLHQLRQNLRHTAQETYMQGLERTGISLESIPKIEAMNERLRDIGWQAVVVDGFVPPAIFMEFQAHRVLVIAVDMRSIQHMLYTPAPDIVHESAGHAPFIIDVDYAEFLQRFGELGMHAIASQGDMAVYEAIRTLSIIKESPDSTSQRIDMAEQALRDAIAANHTPSEAALLSRLHWWTVEYGLVGTPENYRIFGAGLLSSLGESVNCLDDQRVKKLPLTVDAIKTPYDITTEQPQLFVTRNCRHLSQVLEEFARQMCVHRGGTDSIRKAINAETVNTAVTNAGVEISGRLCDLLTDAVGNLTYLKTQGATQLAYQGKQLDGHGTDFHQSGFGTPIGRLQAMERCLSTYTVDELKQHGIAIEQPVELNFLSGVIVKGRLLNILRRDQKNLLMTFVDCRVVSPSGELLFDPSWGVFDMAVGDAIVSVYGGSADQDTFPLFKAPSQTTTQLPTYDEATQALFRSYQAVRKAREQTHVDTQTLQYWIDALQDSDEWLLIFEVLELMQQLQLPQSQRLLDRLNTLQNQANNDQSRLIGYGLQRLAVTRQSTNL